MSEDFARKILRCDGCGNEGLFYENFGPVFSGIDDCRCKHCGSTENEVNRQIREAYFAEAKRREGR